MTEIQYKLFKRFLKERGIYIDFFKEARKQPYRRTSFDDQEIPINEFIKDHTRATEGIMNLIGWADSRMGSNFWSYEYNMYCKFFYALQKNRNKVYETFKKIEDFFRKGIEFE